MKPDAHRKLEPYRITAGRLASDASFRNNGAFMLPLLGEGTNDDPIRLSVKPIGGTRTMAVIISDQDGWDHVSCSFDRRCPKWEEMAFIKALIFEPQEAAFQLHPAEAEYANLHPYCLHIWRPHNARIPLPPMYMIGPKEPRFLMAGIP